MKKLFIPLLLLAACTKPPMYYQQCGKVIEKFVVPHASTTEYVIIYEDTITGTRYECREVTTLTTNSNHPTAQYYPTADVGKQFCETKVKY